MFLGILDQKNVISLYLIFFARIAAACVCGGLIGVERSRRLKEAGVRTHLLVCCTSALIIIISKYGFADMPSVETMELWGVDGADPSRIAAQVVSGISFLCAGVIFKQGSAIKGLTTAAGLWATAGVGLALGAGMFPLGFFTTIAVLLIQFIMHRLPIMNDQYQNSRLEITVADDTGFRHALTKQLDEWHALVMETSISQNHDGTTSYTLVVKMSISVKQEDIFAFLGQYNNVVSFRQTTNG